MKRVAVFSSESNTAEQRPRNLIVAFKTPAFSRNLASLVIGGQCVREGILVRPSPGNTQEAARSPLTALLTLPIAEAELSEQNSEM